MVLVSQGGFGPPAWVRLVERTEPIGDAFRPRAVDLPAVRIVQRRAMVLQAQVVSAVARQPLALSFPVLVIIAPAMLARFPQPIVGNIARLAPALMVLTCAAVLISGRASLPPLGETNAAAAITPAGVTASSAAIEAQLYARSFAPGVWTAYRTTSRAVAAINADTGASGQMRAALIMRDVEPPLRALLRDVAAYRTNSARVASANATCRLALRSTLRSFDSLAPAFATSNRTALAAAEATFSQAQGYWARWLREVVALANGYVMIRYFGG